MDDLVVSTSGGKYGGYSGGGAEVLLNIPGASWVVEKTDFKMAGYFYAAFIILVLLYLAFSSIYGSVALIGGGGFRSGYRDHAGSRLGHASTRDDGYGEAAETNIRLSHLGVEGYRDQDSFATIRSGFINAREAPYFPDVTNRVLRMENREKEAVRALGKINQERLRRAAEDTQSTTPLPWGPFWKEWKQTHPMDGEPGYDHSEGFDPNDFTLPY